MDVVNQESGKLLEKEKNIRVSQALKRRLYDEDGKEARVLTCVSGQDPSGGEKTGGNSQSERECCLLVLNLVSSTLPCIRRLF